MSMFEFPHTREYEGDLGYIIKKVEEIINRLNSFEAINHIKIADPFGWDISTQYGAWTIVAGFDLGFSFISKKPVPAGIDLSNNEYWESIGPLSVDAEARSSILSILHFITNSYEADLIADQAHAIGDIFTCGETATLYRTTAVINIGDVIDENTNVAEDTIENVIIAALPTIDTALNAVSMNPIANRPVYEKFVTTNQNIANVNSDLLNLEANYNVTVSKVNQIETNVTNNTNAIANEAIIRENEDDLLSNRIDAIAALPSGSTAGDAELMDIRTSDQSNVYTNAGSAVRAQANKNQNTSCYITYTRAQLVNNGWINNSGLNPQSSDSWKYSNAIDISAFSGTQFYIYFTATGFNNGSVVVNNIAFFDSNNVFLYGVRHPSASSETTYSDKIELPKNAKYMRICSKNDNTKPFFVSLYKRPSFTVVDPCAVYANYIHKEIVYTTDDDGYLDTSGAFHAASAATWHSSPLKYTEGFNKVYYNLNANNQVAAIAIYRADQSLIRVVSGPSSSYTVVSGVLDISEATYIRYCYHCDYTDTNTKNHVILYNVPAFNKYDSSNAHVVNKPYSFSGKKAIFFGDSITQGVTSPGIITPNGYPKQFSDMVGLNFTNSGVSGASIARVAGYPCIYDTVAAADLTGVDYVFIMGGSNDWQLGVTLSDFADGIQDIIDVLGTNGYTGEIIFIAPIDTAGRKPMVTPSADLEAFRQTAKEISLTNDISFVNGKLFDMPTARSTQAYINEMFGDAIHPSEHGYTLIARALRSILL